jgi:hypothetical protein
VIGVNQFRSIDVSPLRYAEGDAREIGDILTKLGAFSVNYMIGSSATRTAIIARLQEMCASPMLQTILIYFTEHALVQEGVLRLVAADSTVRKDSSLLSIRDLSSILRASRSREKMLVLDTCFAGRALEGIL